jgi:hypothetical protein
MVRAVNPMQDMQMPIFNSHHDLIHRLSFAQPAKIASFKQIKTHCLSFQFLDFSTFEIKE